MANDKYQSTSEILMVVKSTKYIRQKPLLVNCNEKCDFYNKSEVLKEKAN